MKTGHKLALSLTGFIASFPMMRIDGWFGLGVLIGLLLSILYWFDFGRELRQAPPENRGLRILGLLMGLPQALFGLLSLAFGLAIIVWVLYNSLWHADPHYTGGFLTFGLGPVMTLFGAALLWDAFRRSPSDEPEHNS